MIKKFQLPYDLTNGGELSGMDIVAPGRYRSWSSLLNVDGSHSSWRRGPDIVSWNSTGEIRKKNYTIQVKIAHEAIKGISKVKATISWHNFNGK
jgi:hypothetical protein